MELCAIFQSLDPEIDAQIKERYRNKFKLDSDVEPSQQVSFTHSIMVLFWLLYQFVSLLVG